jgi:hypothetical protein
MPQIIVTAGHSAHDNEMTVTLRERVNAEDFESERFAANLVERLGWAVLDAVEAERRDPPAPRPERQHRRREQPITGSRRRDTESERELEPVGSA